MVACRVAISQGRYLFVHSEGTDPDWELLNTRRWKDITSTVKKMHSWTNDPHLQSKLNPIMRMNVWGTTELQGTSNDVPASPLPTAVSETMGACIYSVCRQDIHTSIWPLEALKTMFWLRSTTLGNNNRVTELWDGGIQQPIKIRFPLISFGSLQIRIQVQAILEKYRRERIMCTKFWATFAFIWDELNGRQKAEAKASQGTQRF